MCREREREKKKKRGRFFAVDCGVKSATAAFFSLNAVRKRDEISVRVKNITHRSLPIVFWRAKRSPSLSLF